MYIKKATAGILVCALLFAACACARTDAGSASGPLTGFASLEQLSAQADIIVIGSVERMEDADDFAWFYHVKVTDTLRGGEKDELAVYGNSKLIEAGKQYCLFLYENDFEFWPMPLTLLVDRDSVFEIDGDNVHAPERYKLSGAKDAFMSVISLLPASSGREVRSVTERLDSAELISRSDNIFTARLEEATYTSPYAGGTATLSVLEVHKGSDAPTGEKELNLLIPQGLEAGRTYLFFRSNGLEGMPSRSNSVIDAEAPEYAQLRGLLP